MTHKIIFVLGLCAIFFSMGCGDDEEMVTEMVCTDMPASGMINGSPFSFGQGIAMGKQDEMVRIQLNNAGDFAEEDDPCFNGSGELAVFGTLPAAEVGRVELFLDLGAFEGQTLTMFSRDGFTNITAINGFVEFTSVTESVIEGILDIDDGLPTPVDRVCGSFTLTRCQ